MSAAFREVDETVERDLFERRARALGEPAGVPSLDAVLRAASEEPSVAVPVQRLRDEPRDNTGARARAWSGFALAAACVIAVMKTVPHSGAPTTIAADVGRDAGASIAVAAGASTAAPVEELESHECSTGDPPSESAMTPVTPIAPAQRLAHVVPVAAPTEGATCDAPIATFESPATLSCDRDEGTRTETP